MKTDELTKCSRCGDESCYVQYIPPTMLRLDYCLGCGFQSSPSYNDAQTLEASLKYLPTIYKILIDQEEESLKIWIPTFINVEGLGVIYANGIDRDNWWWESTKYDKKMNPPKLKVADIQKFSKDRGFTDAMNSLGLLDGILK